MNMVILNREINNLRERLYALITCNKLTDENVVECSQKLDKLILEYQKHKKF